ncbi:NAD(P)-binding protein [Mycobacterium sp. 1245852.3]|uniref:NAD(P)-binding protein n=1 Tax=Mycobacterium sp. 1245852.3 TaxID=1856860 RepID=UPI0008022A75|nr:NAD(P)-binding protein [Mycobacterium sp. 1245852.3]OBK01556.1 oxidoreductase [Mycobacterium sp. 1245852.3]
MTESICTPGSGEPRPTVAVLGAGIAGLTAAHELAERGFVVTVYEGRPDERNGLGAQPAGTYPPVKIGGLAASQYSTVGPQGGSQAQLRPFPGRRGQPRPPGRAVAGEHGFRFFPAYYLHTWDMFQRIPVYQYSGTAGWTPTSRTVYDNVRRVITQGMTVGGKPSLVFPRELPRSPAEFLGILSQIAGLGFTAEDLAIFQSRILRYLATSPLRRAIELQNLSAYDFFVGYDSSTGTRQFSYSPSFDALLREMPRVLAAFDSRWGDARTNITTYLQLYLNMDRHDDKADGVLNGPTTEVWFDNWYHHLVALGVRFVRGVASRLDSFAFDPSQPPHLRPRVQITFADGTRVTPDYTVVAVDAPAAESITAPLRAAGTGGTVGRLDGFTTSAPPPDGPLQPASARVPRRRNPYNMDELGRVPWDRFQTLCGIQYYFDTEFQLLRGHMLYAGTEWALSSINQHGFWEKEPILDRDGHVSVLSVDVGDFNTLSRHLGKAARDCAPDELAAEVWRQIVAALTSNNESLAAEAMPWPAWYALDRGLKMAAGPGQGQGRVVQNETPYLVPIIGDWDNRPGSDPWNPHGSSWSSAPPEDWWLEDLELRNVWQARHGGYQVHNNSVVFGGTWNKTFTRMTSMEAACESGRHAVNAILDHYVWVASGGRDRREKTTLAWEFPFGFLDQGLSSPIRFPTPAGDYCYVFDCENREPADTRLLRNIDSKFCEQSLPHPLDIPAALSFGAPPSPIPTFTGGQKMFTPTADSNQQLLNYLQAWRQILDQWTAMAAASPFPNAPNVFPTAPPGGQFAPPFTPFMPLMPTAPFMPPAPSAAATSPAPPAPADYAQQLFSYLQAWRQYLEQAAGTMAPSTQPSNTGQPTGVPNGGGNAGTKRPPDTPIPPGSDTGSKSGPQDGDGNGSSSTWPPPMQRLAPDSYTLSQISGVGSELAGTPIGGGTETSQLIPPDVDWSTQYEPIELPRELIQRLDATASSARPRASQVLSETPEPQAGSAFLRTMHSVEPSASPQVAPRSLFSTPGASTSFREHGETPSP